jgi:DNA recombination protein RmuC
MREALIGLAGVAIGAAVVFIVGHLRRKSAEEVARQLVDQTQAQRASDLNAVIAQLKDAFGSLSRDALAGNSEEFLKLARTRLEQQTLQGESALESKKKLIDANLEALKSKLGELNTAVQSSEKDRREAFGRLIKELENTGKITTALSEKTAQLAAALASPSHRGSWGERMAEDVLRLAGLVEGINYRKQLATEAGTKPDYVFMLPTGPRVNMDVKFPLANYLRYLQCDEAAAPGFRKAFIQDVRSRIKEVTSRDYIDPSDGTIDFVLVFIPNEQLYGFIHDSDPELLEYAMSRKVVLCSPLTLFAILAVIRQAADNFQLQKASNEILALLGTFAKQWEKYGSVVDQLGKRLEAVMKSYGELTTTRTRLLERQLDKIEELRKHRNVALPEEGEVISAPESQE